MTGKADRYSDVGKADRYNYVFLHLVIIIIMIILKGAILITEPQTVSSELSPTRTLKWSGRNGVQVLSSGQGAMVCKSRATHRVLITCNMSWLEATKPPKQTQEEKLTGEHRQVMQRQVY